MNGAWADNQVYWATLAYARWWLAVDGPFLGAVKAERGFTETLLRRVAVRYNVNRGLLQPKGQQEGKDVSASGMINLLRGAVVDWPSGILNRAEVCVQIAEAAQQAGWTDKLQVSGVSKFIWFLKPERWTLFDRFAAKGMGVPAHWSRRRQFEAFYKALDNGDFDGVVARIEPLVAGSILPGLPAARIIDSLLMARGARGSGTHEVEESRAFLALLPPEFRDHLHRLATRLQDEIGMRLDFPPFRFERSGDNPSFTDRVGSVACPERFYEVGLADNRDQRPGNTKSKVVGRSTNDEARRLSPPSIWGPLRRSSEPFGRCVRRCGATGVGA